MVLMVRATPINTGQQHSAIGAKSPMHSPSLGQRKRLGSKLRYR